MMTIADASQYRRHRLLRQRESMWSAQAFWLPATLFGSMGAITWAIRGTTGWGGIDGTVVPGLTWGLLWYYLCRRRGIDARAIVFWLGMGIAIGGELGYGQYTSWIRGNFHTPDGIVSISPWIGYAWFVICGIGWGAPGGIVLGWALNSKVSAKGWLIRSILLASLLVLIFNLGESLFGSGIVDSLGAFFARHDPSLLFPRSDMNLYAGDLDGHLGRTVYTNTQNFAVLIWWIAAMAVAAAQRDRATLVSGAIVGGAFGIGFAQSAAWCLAYAHAPDYIDWWKVWELNAGFNLGVLYVIVLNWATRQTDNEHSTDGIRTDPLPAYAYSHKTISVFLSLAGFVLVFGSGYEYFYWTGVVLAVVFVTLMCLAHRTQRPGEDNVDLCQRRRAMLLLYSAFLLAFILLHGATSKLGVLLELYPREAVSEYEWPAGRVWLMLVAAPVLVLATLTSIYEALRHPRIAPYPSHGATRLPVRMGDFFTATGIVGALTIWPDKIGVLYAVFICLAFFAFNRINRRHDCIDRECVTTLNRSS